MPIDLYFDLAPAARLAEHGLAAARHAVDPDGLSAHDTPALWLVNDDDGIWLACNGLPGLPVDVLDSAAGASWIFAHGWASGRPRTARPARGARPAPVTVIGVLGQPIDALREPLRGGRRRLRITVDGACSTLRVEDPGPTPTPANPPTRFPVGYRPHSARPSPADLGTLTSTTPAAHTANCPPARRDRRHPRRTDRQPARHRVRPEPTRPGATCPGTAGRASPTSPDGRSPSTSRRPGRRSCGTCSCSCTRPGTTCVPTATDGSPLGPAPAYGGRAGPAPAARPVRRVAKRPRCRRFRFDRDGSGAGVDAYVTGGVSPAGGPTDANDS
jgi:hypothetical protein